MPASHVGHNRQLLSSAEPPCPRELVHADLAPWWPATPCLLASHSTCMVPYRTSPACPAKPRPRGMPLAAQQAAARWRWWPAAHRLVHPVHTIHTELGRSDEAESGPPRAPCGRTASVELSCGCGASHGAGRRMHAAGGGRRPAAGGWLVLLTCAARGCIQPVPYRQCHTAHSMTSPVSMILAVPGGLGKAGMAWAAAAAAGGGAAADKQREGWAHSPSVAAAVSPSASRLDSCMH